MKIYPIGRTWLRIDGEAWVAVVAFGPKHTEPPIGAHTLEAFGLGVDRSSQGLIRVDGLLE